MNISRTISGAILLIILAILLIFSIVDIAKMPGVVQPNLLFSPEINNLITWAVVIYTSGFLIGIALAISKELKFITRWSRLITVQADIPGYFFASFVPIFFGIFLIVIDQVKWGIGLACLSVPAIVVFLWVELRRRNSGQ